MAPLTLLLTSLFACAHSGDALRYDYPPAPRFAGVDLIDGGPEAFGVLDLLNDPATTRRDLTRRLTLDRRAAAALIAHRDGADRAPGTADDDRFDSVVEVADAGVGPATMGLLVSAAHAEGRVPDRADVLGAWDGVTFTVAQAEGTLAFVNGADANTLDHDAQLNRRAVDSILRARPLKSVQQLSELYFVGRDALRRLQNATGSRHHDAVDEKAEVAPQPGQHPRGDGA